MGGCCKMKDVQGFVLGGKSEGYEIVIDKYSLNKKEYIMTIKKIFGDGLVRGDRETPRIAKRTYQICEGNKIAERLKLINEICIIKNKDLNEYDRLSEIITNNLK